jgi:hypothetical protein
MQSVEEIAKGRVCRKKIRLSKRNDRILDETHIYKSLMEMVDLFNHRAILIIAPLIAGGPLRY